MRGERGLVQSSAGDGVPACRQWWHLREWVGMHDADALMASHSHSSGAVGCCSQWHEQWCRCTDDPRAPLWLTYHGSRPCVPARGLAGWRGAGGGDLVSNPRVTLGFSEQSALPLDLVSLGHGHALGGVITYPVASAVICAVMVSWAWTQRSTGRSGSIDAATRRPMAPTSRQVSMHPCPPAPRQPPPPPASAAPSLSNRRALSRIRGLEIFANRSTFPPGA